MEAQLMIDSLNDEFINDLPTEAKEQAMAWLIMHTTRTLSGIAFYKANTEKLAPDMAQKR